MVDFNNIADVREWFGSRSKQTNVIMAGRTAARVIPVLPITDTRETSADAMVLSIFWACATALVLGRWPNRVGDVQAISAADAAYTARTRAEARDTYGSNDVASVAGAVGAAAATTVDKAYSGATVRAVSSALYAVKDYHFRRRLNDLNKEEGIEGFEDFIPYHAVYELLSWDATELNTQKATGISRNAEETPLWPRNVSMNSNLLERSMDTFWKEIKTWLLKKDKNWAAWTIWYERFLDQNMKNEDYEIERLIAIQDLFDKHAPDKGSALINAKLIEIEERYLTGTTPNEDTVFRTSPPFNHQFAFVSYASNDRYAIKPYVTFLRDQGIPIMWDRDNIPGDEWRKILTKHLNNATLILPFWTQASIDSQDVREEADIGKKANKLLPIHLEDVNRPFGFSEIQHQDLYDWDGTASHPGMRKILSVLRDRLGLDTDTATSIAQDTPLAETIAINDNGVYDVTFVPVIDLYDTNLKRVADALRKAVTTNAFSETSDEVEYLREMIAEHADDPQRMHDDCRFAHKAILDLIEAESIPQNFNVNRLLDALNQTRVDILTNNAKVREAVETRATLHMDSSASVDEPETVEESLRDIEPIVTEALGEEFQDDIQAVITGDSTRLQAAYRLLSRTSRIFLDITRRQATASADTGGAAAASAHLHLDKLVEALPSLKALIDALKPFLGL